MVRNFTTSPQPGLIKHQIFPQNYSIDTIAILITGVFGLSIIPIILGYIDRIRIKNGLNSSKGMALDIVV